MTEYQLTDQEISWIIACVRGCQGAKVPDVHDIITNGGQYPVPTNEELDTLCEKLNLEGVAV